MARQPLSTFRLFFVLRCKNTNQALSTSRHFLVTLQSMKKRTAALTLVLIGPTLIAGCSSRDDCDPKTENCDDRRSGYHGGGYYGGGSYRGRSGGSSASESGGFGGTGRGFFGGS
jgi:hypothetical protein